MKRTVATVGLVCALMIGCMGMPPVNGCNLMIAFTGKNFPYGGWGYVGGAGCLVIDQGYPANASVARHEVGHNYGCPDQYNDPNPPVCFMNDCYNQFNDICSTCYSTWYGNRYDK